MCGIAAIFSRQAPVAPATIERATRSLYHRGPDGQRHWISADGRVALGHARLSIIDLATGDQPIASEDERTRIIVNGEFYDFEAIQHELERGGHRLRTRSDSEIALHLYEDIGLQCVHRLRGEFAMVLWDERNRTMVAVRDRFGIKPLFYAWHDGALYLASEVKALFAAGVPARWDTDAVSHSFELGGPQTSTLYDGVRQVPPGHYLIATDRDFQLHQYLGLQLSRGSGCPSAPCGGVRRGVSRCARGGGPSAVARRRAGRLLSERRARFLRHDRTGRPASSRSDPGVYADLRSARLRRRTGSARDGDPRRRRVPSHPDRPGRSRGSSGRCRASGRDVLLNAHGVAKYLLSRAVRDAGYKVVITGEGSDEILGGYAHFRRDMLMYNREGQDPDSPGRDAPAAGSAQPGLTRPAAAARCEQTARPRQAPARLRPVVDGDVLRARGQDGRPVLDGLCAALWIARELRRAPERARRAAGSSAAGIQCTSRCISGPRRACQATFSPHSAIGWRWRTPSKGACHFSTITSSRWFGRSR